MHGDWFNGSTPVGCTDDILFTVLMPTQTNFRASNLTNKQEIKKESAFIMNMPLFSQTLSKL
jgi:hypothetical protein